MDNAMFYAGLILSKTPGWAYLVLVALCVLGRRRLTSRPTSPVGLAIVPIVFLSWSLVGATAFGSVSGPLTAVCRHGANGLTDDSSCGTGSWGPLLVYVGIFFFRYGLEIWAGFSPERALTAHSIAVILSGYGGSHYRRSMAGH